MKQTQKLLDIWCMLQAKLLKRLDWTKAIELLLINR